MTKKNIKVHEFKIYSIKGKKISQFVEINYTQYSSDIKKTHKMSTPTPKKKEPMECPGVEGETASTSSYLSLFHKVGVDLYLKFSA